MMRNVRGIILSVITLAGLVLTTTSSRGQAVMGGDANVVKWDAIVGVAAPGSKVGNFDPFGTGIPLVFPISVQDGRALVQLQTGRMEFSVKGLALANSTALAVAGTTGVISEVMGTLVCNGIAGVVSEYTDTPAIALSPQGNAYFAGAIQVPTACLLTPDKLAFLIRVASVSNPAATIQVGRWVALGAVRTP
jgi:hypothetical protein